MLTHEMKPRLAWSIFLLCGLLVVALVSKEGNQPSPIHGAPPSYTITLDSTNAPTSITDTFVEASQTVRYTPFEYSAVKYLPGNHAVLETWGVINNAYDTRITSVTGVTANFTTDGTFTLRATYDEFNYFNYVLESGVHLELPFLPYFLEFIAGDFEVIIESIAITYSCTPHEESLDQYTVTWYDEDWNILEQDVNVVSGSMPSYEGPLPTKASLDETYFSFNGWDYALTPVLSNQEYWATFVPYIPTYRLINGSTEYELTDISVTTLVSISIPETYNGLPVTSIADEVFLGFTSLATVELPSTITNIGSAAFGDCSSLTTINLPANVTTLGILPFGGCSSLTAIAVDPANTTFSSLDGVLFNEAQTTLIAYPNGKGTSYTIPDGVTTISDFAFAKSTTLLSVTLPASVTTLGVNVFLECLSLDNVVIPDTVTTLGGGTFIYCLSLTNVTLPSGLTSLPYSIFQACTSLVSVTLPEGLTNIEMDAFKGCTSLATISIPGGVTNIGPRAFQDCLALANPTFPTGLLSIGGNAFTNCDSLTSVNIPASVTSLGGYVFTECSLLTAINVDVANTVYASMDGVLCSEDLTTLILYPSGRSNASYTIPSSITTILSNAFRSNPHLTSLYIPITVTTIDAYGIYLCFNIADIHIAPSEKPAGWNDLWNASVRHVLYGEIF